MVLTTDQMEKEESQKEQACTIVYRRKYDQIGIDRLSPTDEEGRKRERERGKINGTIQY